MTKLKLVYIHGLDIVVFKLPDEHGLFKSIEIVEAKVDTRNRCHIFRVSGKDVSENTIWSILRDYFNP